MVEGFGSSKLAEFEKKEGYFALASESGAAPFCACAADFPGVSRALRDLASDLEKVSGKRPAIELDRLPKSGEVLLAGTIGRNPLIDELISGGKLDAAQLGGKWEAYLIATVDEPFPGVERAFVIAGSDKRGTIYGIYELSAAIGVSPWHWWADSKPDEHDRIYLKPGSRLDAGPSVKYRGIFLNDEYPALTKWVAATYGMAKPGPEAPAAPDSANYGHEFYEKLFELILRLKGNFLWPAMWNNAFNEDDPANPKLADEYGIVMGTSHQEPMLRAQKEWDRRYKAELGYWNYRRDAELLHRFWKEGIERNKDYESVVTIGLRGADDTALAEGGPEASKDMLERIVEKQRDIIAEGTGKDPGLTPQAWCLYKEAQDYYDIGLRVPEDVTLLWAEDNWGNVRRLPTAQERGRPGGAGIYYHFDYHGGPRSYQWINTSPIAKIYDQLSLAEQYGADRIWVVNVGHFRGYELPMEFFLDLAWNTRAFSGERLEEYHRRWAEKEFGAEKAAEIARIVSAATRINGRMKPELLSPETYSLVDYREGERVVEEYRALAEAAEAVNESLPLRKRDAFYQLVLFPAKACALVNALYHAAGKNALYHAQGRASANAMKAEVERLFAEDLALMRHYNEEFSGGKWKHFMDQPHLGYLAWNDPPENSLQAIKLREVSPAASASMGVAVEGSATAASSATDRETLLPGFDWLNRQERYFEIFNEGSAPFDFRIDAKPEWASLSEVAGRVEADKRIRVSVDWDKAPLGEFEGKIELSGAGAKKVLLMRGIKRAAPDRASLQGFAEDSGAVSMEAEHYSAKREGPKARWTRIEGYGHTLSGMRAESETDVAGLEAGKDAPCLEYRFYLHHAAKLSVHAYFSPSLNFMPGRGLRFALSLDEGKAETVTLVPEDFKAQNGNREWEESVIRGYRIGKAGIEGATEGHHVLKIWMVDPGLVLQKIVIDAGGLKPSFLGPPESYRGS